MSKQQVNIDAFNIFEIYEGDERDFIIIGLVQGVLIHDRLTYFNIDKREAEGSKFSYWLAGCEINWYQMLIEKKMYLKDFNFDKRLV